MFNPDVLPSSKSMSHNYGLDIRHGPNCPKLWLNGRISSYNLECRRFFFTNLPLVMVSMAKALRSSVLKHPEPESGLQTFWNPFRFLKTVSEEGYRDTWWFGNISTDRIHCRQYPPFLYLPAISRDWNSWSKTIPSLLWLVDATVAFFACLSNNGTFTWSKSMQLSTLSSKYMYQATVNQYSRGYLKCMSLTLFLWLIGCCWRGSCGFEHNGNCHGYKTLVKSG